MAIYCSHCRASLPDEARFCMKCGTLLPGSVGVPGNYWEYKEFSEGLEKYTGVAEYRTRGWPFHGLPDPVMREPINRAVQSLLSRVASEGWEPNEPIDATRLWDAERVSRKVRQSMLGYGFLGLEPYVGWTLLEVRITCRRRVRL